MVKKKLVFLFLFLIINILAFSALGDLRPVTININTNLENGLNIIAKSADVDLVIDENVPKSKPLQIQSDSLPIAEVLNLVLQLNNLKMTVRNAKTIVIFPPEKEKQYAIYKEKAFYLKNIESKDIANILSTLYQNAKYVQDFRTNSIIVSASVDDLDKITRLINEKENEDQSVTRTISLTYAKVDQISPFLTNVRKIMNNIIDKVNNAFIVTAKKDDIEEVEKMVRGFDVKPAQSVINITLLDASNSFTQTLGINWNDSISIDDLRDMKVGTVLMPKSLTASDIRSAANILANPTIRVVNNEEAKINIGERVPIVIGKPTGAASTSSSIATVPSVEYKDVGIQMQVIPTVHQDGEITIKLDLEVSSLGEKSSQTEYGDYPTFVTKNISTIIRLKDGETAVFGGLINNEERTKKVTLPFLGDIPILGNLFFVSSEKVPKKSEIIMLITPRIVNYNGKDRSAEAKEWDKKRSEKTREIIEKLESNK